jgi:hypothetical protein
MSIVLGIILSAAFWIGPPQPLPQPLLRPLQGPEKPLLYCFSGSETSDDVTAYFCRRLAAEGREHNRFDVVTEREQAHAQIELRGVDSFATHGDVTVLTKDDWSPEQYRIRVEAVLTVGDTVKSFIGEGDLYEATAEVVEAIEKWVGKNPNALRESNGK